MVSKFESSNHELVLFQAMIRFSSQSSNFILVANDQGIEGCSAKLLGTGRLFRLKKEDTVRLWYNV